MRQKTILYVVVLVVFLFSCKKSGNESEDKTFTLQGTVYVDDVPRSNVLVEIGIKGSIYQPTWNEISRNTDENGDYLFKETTGSTLNFGAYYRVRVMNPVTSYWTDYKSGSIPIGQTATEDFFILSGQN